MIFRTLIKNHKKMIILYIASGIAISVLQAFGVNLFQRMLDKLVERTLETSAVFIYGIIITAVCVLSYLDNIPDSKLGNGIYFDLKIMALKKMSVISYTDYQKMGVGKLIHQIENGASAGKNILFNFYFCLARELLPDIIISLVFIFIIDMTLIRYVLIGYIAVFVVTNIVLKYLYRIKSRILINEEFMNHYLVRGIMELVVFRTNGRYATEIKKTKQAADTIVANKTKMLMTHEFFFTLFALLVIVLKIFVIFYGMRSQSVSIGEIVALMTFLDRAYSPIAIFNVMYVQFKLDKVAFQRYEEVLDSKNDEALHQGKKIDVEQGKIEFLNVGFSYGDKTIIKDLSFCIEPGSSVAFAGESGVGKSTVIKQITGLIKPCEGNIFIDGYDLSNMELNHYYGSISYTSQDSPIFNGTLYENIVFDRQVSEEDIVRVLELVKLDEFYKSLPRGLETEVGEKGLLLSGGERQRLALARIFFQKAKIIILDEATSAMDNLTEEMVMNNVMQAFRDRTLIIIAHRLSSIRKADNIIVLKNGSIAELGQFEDLLERNGYFSELWNREIQK